MMRTTAKNSRTRTVVSHSLVGAALMLSALACGDDDLKPVPRRGIAGGAAPAAAPPPAPGTAPAATGTESGSAVMVGGSGVMIYSKVSDEYRKKLDEAAFASDAMGDLNRDPFRSYVFGQYVSATSSDPTQDVCKRRTVAPGDPLRSLNFVGVVLRGTKGYAMFTDNQGRGHTVNRGDCLAKEKARVEAIGQDRVTLQIRGEAAQGAVAPAPREEVIELRPDEIDISEQLLGTGAR